MLNSLQTNDVGVVVNDHTLHVQREQEGVDGFNSHSISHIPLSSNVHFYAGGEASLIHTLAAGRPRPDEGGCATINHWQVIATTTKAFARSGIIEVANTPSVLVFSEVQRTTLLVDEVVLRPQGMQVLWDFQANLIQPFTDNSSDDTYKPPIICYYNEGYTYVYPMYQSFNLERFYILAGHINQQPMTSTLPMGDDS